MVARNKDFIVFLAACCGFLLGCAFTHIFSSSSRSQIEIVPCRRNLNCSAGSKVLEEVVADWPSPGAQWLTIRKMLFQVNSNGYIDLDYSKIQRFAFDIGTSVNSPSVKGNPNGGWMKDGRGQDLHVFMIEPNKYSSMSIELNADPAYAHSEAHKYQTWGGCLDLTCNHDWFKGTLDFNSQWHMINAAAFDSEGYTFFQAGNYKNAGTGSLFEYAEGGELDNAYRDVSRIEYSQPVPIPTIQVRTLMEYIPPHMPIEVIKIDAQGADAQIVTSIPIEQLQRVKCLVGEFSMGGYAQKAGNKHTDYRQHLIDAGFVEGKGTFYNSKFKHDFASGAQHYCFSWDTPWQTNAEIVALMR